MKCDKLKSFIVRYNGEFIRAYNETEVDKAIEELKEFAEDFCLERDDNQAAINELNDELESLKATHYTESVDAGMENRRLKRELLRQKYKRCFDKANYWLAVSYKCIDDKHRQNAEKHHYKWLEIAEKFKMR